MDAYQEAFNGRRNDLAEQHVVCPVRHKSTYCCYGNIIYKPHHRRKNRKGQDTVCNNAVDLIGNCHLLPGMLLFAALSDDRRDVIIPFVGDNAFRVVIHLPLYPGNFRGNIRNCGKLGRDLIVLFQKLHGKETSLFLRHRISQFIFYGIQNFFHFLIEIMYRRIYLAGVSKLYGHIRRSFYALALQRGNFHHGATQLFRQLIRHDLISVLSHQIHHIHRHHYRDPQFHKLCAQVKISFQVRAVDDIQDRVRLFIDQIISGYHFLQRIRGQRIYSRKIRDHHIFISLQFSFFLFHRYTRPVSNKLVCTCQRVEQSCLSAVWIAGQRDCNCHLSFLLYSTTIISASAFRTDSS